MYLVGMGPLPDGHWFITHICLSGLNRLFEEVIIPELKGI